MRMPMYSIYDAVAEVFHKPFTAHNDADAYRGFLRGAEEHKASKVDFFLYNVGEWNDATGEMSPKIPVRVAIDQRESEAA